MQISTNTSTNSKEIKEQASTHNSTTEKKIGSQEIIDTGKEEHENSGELNLNNLKSLSSVSDRPRIIRICCCERKKKLGHSLH
ncbi:unnamed protein product, partial [Allacma fusca]